MRIATFNVNCVNGRLPVAQGELRLRKIVFDPKPLSREHAALLKILLQRPRPKDNYELKLVERQIRTRKLDPLQACVIGAA